MKIAIAGSGALGSCFGFMLHQAGNEVTLIDGWKDHVNVIKDDGLTFTFGGEEKNSKIPIHYPHELKSLNKEFDLIILLTKAMQLDEMVQAIEANVTSKTSVLCLLNGIGHDEVVEKYIPKENFILGNTMWSAGLDGPGKVRLHPNGSIDLKNMHPNGLAAAQAVVETLTVAGLNARYAEEVLYSIYKKVCVNATLNGLCTILDSNIAGVGKTTVAETIIRNIVDEIVAVAAHENVQLDLEEILENIRSTFDPLGIGAHFPSMHQDLIKNNRLTEIDYINGSISKKGAKYGVATPFNSFLTELVHCKEEILGAS